MHSLDSKKLLAMMATLVAGNVACADDVGPNTTTTGETDATSSATDIETGAGSVGPVTMTTPTSKDPGANATQGLREADDEDPKDRDDDDATK